MKAQPGSSIEPRDPEPRRGPSQATKRMAALSPRFKARMAGVFQFLEALTSAGGQVVILGSLVVAGSAAMTATNILAHQQLVWLGFASSLMGPLARPARREHTRRIYAATGAGSLTPVSQTECAGLRHLPGVLRALVRADRLPHFPVDLSASHSGGAVDD